jgi:hypothetical protein
MRSGRVVRLWQDELGPFPPYRLDADALIISFFSTAEFGTHNALGWGEPVYALDAYVEFRHFVNDGHIKSGVTLTINLRQPVVSDRNFVEVKLVGKSTQFPREFIGRYASSLVPIPPRLLYERRNIRDSQLKVGDFANYRGRQILVVTGTADADHPRKLDESIVEFFNKNGAKADYIYLGDRGIVGMAT